MQIFSLDIEKIFFVWYNRRKVLQEGGKAMGIHTGDPCFACQQILQENDDVVVCSACGTPYHRACWQKNGACINFALHESGGSWKKAQAEVPCVCPNCGTKNDPGTVSCKNCGASLSETPYQSSWQHAPEQTEPEKQPETFRQRMQQAMDQMGFDEQYCGMDQEERLGEERLGDVADFVAKNQVYYLPKFLRFDRRNRKFSINFTCLFFPYLYFAYRKMWPLALVLTLAFALMQLPQIMLTLQVSLPDLIAAMESGDASTSLVASLYTPETLQTILDRLDAHVILIENATTVCNYLDICITLLCGLFGNWFYYRYVMCQVKKVREEGLSLPVRKVRMQQQGGTNIWLLLGAVLLEYVLMVALSAAVMMILMV